MKRNALLFAFILLLLIVSVPCLVNALPIVCVPTGASGTDANEESALQGSLTAMGYTLRLTNDPLSSDCTVYVSHPGQAPGGNGPGGLLPWVQAGNGVVQISDWGPGLMSNDYAEVTEGSSQTVVIVDSGHPITSGLPASWSSRGFWAYGYTGSDFIAWATSAGDPNLVRAGGYDKALSARTEGSGRLVFIGWNVYGPLATNEDLTILSQAINWASSTGGVPDLLFTSLSGRGSNSGPLTIQLRVKNTGTAASAATTARCYLAGKLPPPGTVALAPDIPIPAIAAGAETATITMTFQPRVPSSGMWWYVVCTLDPDNLMQESNEGNNTKTGYVLYH